MGQPELVKDPRFQGNKLRVLNVSELDRLIGILTVQHTAADLDRMPAAADIPSTFTFTPPTSLLTGSSATATWSERSTIHCSAKVLHAGIVPHMPDEPGTIRWPGPPIGAHTDEVLRDGLGLSAPDIAALRQEGVVG
jgi:crotonobetainyl-CoA:carnitine CoA-transferase CaiB-like acyl-CoA transferase